MKDEFRILNWVCEWKDEMRGPWDEEQNTDGRNL